VILFYISSYPGNSIEPSFFIYIINKQYAIIIKHAVWVKFLDQNLLLLIFSRWDLAQSQNLTLDFSFIILIASEKGIFHWLSKLQCCGYQIEVDNLIYWNLVRARFLFKKLSECKARSLDRGHMIVENITCCLRQTNIVTSV